MEDHGVTVETVRAGRHDFATANGRMMARITASVARGESELKSERITRAMAQRAAVGRPHGPARFGWRRERSADCRDFHDVIAPAEAAVLREIADRIIAGDSVSAIAADLTGRDVPKPPSGRWSRYPVRTMVMRPINVAERVHRGEVVGDGDWPPILDRAIWEQVPAILADPARRTTAGGRAAHLLSGIAKCGVCGSVVRVATRGHRSGIPVYRCQGRRL